MFRFLPLVFVLLIGCGSSGITLYKMVDGEPQVFAQVDQKFAGKGCVAVDSNKKGETSVIVQQAGTSDWSVSRLMGFLGETAGAVFGAGAGTGEMQSPATGMQGCEGLFVVEEVDSEPDPETLYKATPVEPKVE